MDKLFWNLYERSGDIHPISLINKIEYMGRILKESPPDPNSKRPATGISPNLNLPNLTIVRRIR